MKSRKFISVMTMLSCLPGLFAPAALFMGFTNPTMVILVLLAFVFRGCAGVVGSVQLWRGKEIGYKLASVGWAYLAIAGTVTLITLHLNVTPSFELTQMNSAMYLKPLSNGVGKVFWSSIFLYILIKDLLNASSNNVKVYQELS